jgi:hypothetical protein
MKQIAHTCQGWMRFKQSITRGALAVVLALPLAALSQPDLTVDAARLQSSVDFRTMRFRSSDCAVIEGCARAGKRTVMRFDVATPNIGNADLVLGDPRNNPTYFEFSPCHGHYHFSGYALYELLTLSGARVVSGRKQAFCLLDSSPYLPNAGPSHGYNCFYQGITAGWQDVYTKSLDCQWLDVTDVPGGDYLLRVTINPEARLVESDYSNNVATVPVRIPSKNRR